MNAPRDTRVTIRALLGFASFPAWLLTAAVIARANEIARVSLASDGSQVTYGGGGGSISADARFVTFDSDSPELGATFSNYSAFVRDRDPDGDGVFDSGSGVTTMMSVDSNEVPGDGQSFDSRISADGRHVAFDSTSTNLASGDNTAEDVFVRDRDPDRDGIFDESNAVTLRLSNSTMGVHGNGQSYVSAISATGRHVLFWSTSSNLIDGRTATTTGVYVSDRDPDDNGILDEGNTTTTRMDVDASGNDANARGFSASISPDGRFAAFTSSGTNLVSNDANGLDDVFVHDRDADGDGVFDEGNVAIARVSLGSGGVESSYGGGGGAISADARFVLFSSNSSDLVANDSNGWSDAFLHDRDPDQDGIFDEGDGVTIRVSVASDGSELPRPCYGLSISADGDTMLFLTDYAADPSDTNSSEDIYRHRVSTGETTPVAQNCAGFIGDQPTDRGQINSDGNFVAFTSAASNLVPGDTNYYGDVYVADLTVPPIDATWTNYGAGFPGTLGVPAFTSRDDPVLGTTITLDVDNSAGRWTVGVLLFGAARDAIPTKSGGTILVDALLWLPIVIPTNGTTIVGGVPLDVALCGVVADLQVLELDAGAKGGLSFSEGLELVFGG